MRFSRIKWVIFYMNLQFMIIKVCCRKKTFSTHLTKVPPPYWPDPNGKSWAIGHSKSLYKFVVPVEAYPYAKKNHHHGSIQSWHIVNLILRITFGRPRCTWPHPYERTESNRCICVCLTTYKKSTLCLCSF